MVTHAKRDPLLGSLQQPNHAENDHYMRVPRDQEHVVAFPSRCPVVYCSLDAGQGLEDAVGSVEFAAVDLHALESGCMYKVNLGDQVVFAKEKELQYGQLCPVWLRVPGSNQKVAACVVKSYRPSPTSEPQYALRETDSSRVHTGLLASSLEFRHDDSQHPALIAAGTQAKEEYSSNERDENRDGARGEGVYKLESSGESHLNESSTELSSSISRPRREEQHGETMSLESFHQHGDHSSTLGLSNTAQCEQSDCKSDDTRVIVVPGWADFDIFSKHLHRDRLVRLENHFHCRIFFEEPLRDEEDWRVRIEGSSDTIEEISRIIMSEAAHSVDILDQDRFMFDLAMANVRHTVIDDHAVFQWMPPRFLRKGWFSVVRLPRDYHEMTKVLIGRNGAGIKPIMEQTSCSVGVQNSHRSAYLLVSGHAACTVLECRRLVTDKLRTVADKIRRT